MKILRLEIKNRLPEFFGSRFCCCLSESIAEHARKAFVVFHPVLHVHHAERRLVVAYHDTRDACVDHHALAHGAGGGLFHITARFGVAPHEIQGSADHLFARRADDGIRLRMHRAAHLIPLSPRNVQLLADADAAVDAVFAAARRAVVAARDNLVVVHDDCAVTAPQAGAALQNGLRNVQIIIFFVRARHGPFFLLFSFFHYTPELFAAQSLTF